MSIVLTTKDSGKANHWHFQILLQMVSLCGLPVHTAMQPWQRKQKQMQRNSPAAAALHSHAGGAGQGQSADLGVLSPGGCVCGSETNFKGEL